MATRPIVCLFLSAGLLCAGCRSARQIRDPEFDHLTRSVRQAWCDAEPAHAALALDASPLAGPHGVDEYIRVALCQNPEIQAARKRVEAAMHQVPVAGSLQDPMFNVSVQPEPVQTAAGQQEVILSASQKLPWFGKRRWRTGIAESRADEARARLAAAELTVVENVKRAYFELYFIQQAIQVTQTEQKLLHEIRDVANSRYATGRTSQQDVLRADLEIANIENELIRLRQRLRSSQARLARLLHISPQTAVAALDQLPVEDVPADLDGLQRQAVAARPELHAQLAAVERDQRAVELARLEYKPDVTMGLSWIDTAELGISPVANGQDALLLTAGVNLPVYRQRLDSGVRAAEAQAVATAREYDTLRDATLEEVTDLFQQARSQQDLLELFRLDILPTARRTLQISSQAYNVDEVDFLQLVDNWRQLLRYELSHHRLEADLHQTLAALEKAVGVFGAWNGCSHTLCYGSCDPPPLPYTAFADCEGVHCEKAETAVSENEVPEAQTAE